ncbi:uncharacterized protein LOC100829291 isoform X3 [Brachypodium distachyon]|uniref:uncharacterized protein LOC100829291 isoform X3 n=1 Tax=Brachypodium distachyon TaxID=15368 RepID=UPI00071CFEA2|nr:uncharacterized protein LOC100829291 isoform X3 [Brachypodium distachyon]|eukprot:XP_014755021.1 uncharacterized protein LOC100829291 isoform X3 [Brachypodium distachyon]
MSIEICHLSPPAIRTATACTALLPHACAALDPPRCSPVLLPCNFHRNLHLCAAVQREVEDLNLPPLSSMAGGGADTKPCAEARPYCRAATAAPDSKARRGAVAEYRGLAGRERRGSRSTGCSSSEFHRVELPRPSSFVQCNVQVLFGRSYCTQNSVSRLVKINSVSRLLKIEAQSGRGTGTGVISFSVSSTGSGVKAAGFVGSGAPGRGEAAAKRRRGGPAAQQAEQQAARAGSQSGGEALWSSKALAGREQASGEALWRIRGTTEQREATATIPDHESSGRPVGADGCARAAGGRRELGRREGSGRPAGRGQREAGGSSSRARPARRRRTVKISV